jgi:phage protein U
VIWVILKIEETGSELEANGAPRVIAFSITLKEYGGDEGGFGLALAALSTFPNWSERAMGDHKRAT